MRSIILVAIREYRQIASTRGFWVMLLVLPVVIALTQVAGSFIRPNLNSAYVLVDVSGQYDEAIDRRIAINRERFELGNLSAYVQRWGAGSAKPDAVWAKGDRWFTDQQVQQFIAEGGAPAALELIKPKLPKDAPVYKVEPPLFVRAELPYDVSAKDGPDELAKDLGPYLRDVIDTTAGERPLAMAVYIPQIVDAQTPIRVWTNGTPNTGLIDSVRAEVVRVQRLKTLETQGLSPEIAAQMLDATVPIQVSVPPQGEGRELVAIRSVLPLAAAYLLMVTVMVTGSMMLQSVIEERSNKLLESVLAHIRPAELMYGKLLGLGAIGLTILAVWVGAAIFAAFSVQGMVADIVKPSLAAFDQPWMFIAMVFYFFAGYLIISMLYLAIGALSNSLQDAQSYLMPVIFLITLPVVFMMVQVVQAPNSALPVILSWIPLYTPFAMLARMTAGVSIAEVLGTGAMLALFVIAEMYLLGRVFQASLLRTGQPPKLGALIATMLGKQTE